MKVFLTLCMAAGLYGQSAAGIMAKVAANQDRAQSERLQYVYEKEIRVTSRYSGGKVACDELTKFQIIPKAKGFESKELSFYSKTWRKGRFLESTKDATGNESDSLDQALTRSFRDDLGNTPDAKDGIADGLFPLTTNEQKDLEFELEGEESPAGRPAYRIKFRPKNRKDYGWTGEALIDKEEFQPVRVYTRMSRKLPMLVRTLLGTDLPGLGFSTQYTRLDKDVWFPSSFGAEFHVRAVFFLNRNVAISMENKNFQRTAVQSGIRFDDAQPAPLNP